MALLVAHALPTHFFVGFASHGMAVFLCSPCGIEDFPPGRTAHFQRLAEAQLSIVNSWSTVSRRPLKVLAVNPPDIPLDSQASLSPSV